MEPSWTLAVDHEYRLCHRFTRISATVRSQLQFLSVSRERKRLHATAKSKDGTRNSRRDRLHLVFVTEEKKNSKNIRFRSSRAMGKGVVPRETDEITNKRKRKRINTVPRNNFFRVHKAACGFAIYPVRRGWLRSQPLPPSFTLSLPFKGGSNFQSWKR